MSRLSFEDQPLFPGNELYRIHQLLMEEGIPLKMLLTGTGLPEACLTDPGILISWRQFDIIYRNAFRCSQRPEIGLLIGNCLDLSRWGVLGNAMVSCRDIDHALGLAAHYREFVRCPFDFYHTRSAVGMKVALSRRREVELPAGLPFSSEVILMGTLAVVNDMLGEPTTFREVGFFYDPPEYAQHYERLFRCPVKFNCPETYYVVDEKVLKRPLPRANPINYRIARQHCEEKLRQINHFRQQDITVIVLGELASREGESIDLKTMAEYLGLNSRTLRRRLFEKGTSYRDLVNSDRRRRAIDYLENSAMDTETIAALTGFTDTGSFRKAFKRWTGLSPKEYRTELLETSVH